LPLAKVVESQVSCDRKKPRLEPGVAIILRPAFQYTQPGFLHKVFDVLATT
jgi:hypothetical protein